jgi:O-antigen/teichoic acid export membrane protein
MQKTFLSNLILIVVLNLLIKPFYILGIDAEVQNRVGAEIYGNYFALLNFSFLLNILLDFGITNYNSKNISQNPQLVNKHFGQLLTIRFTLFFIYVFFTVGSGLVIGYNSNEIYFLLLLILNQFFVATIQYARSNFAGLHLFKMDAFISVLDRALLIMLCGFLLWSPTIDSNFKIEWFIYAQTATYLLSAIISIVLLKFKIGKIKLQLKKIFSVALLKQSFPYALLILLMMFYNRIDSVMIERLLDDGNMQAGIYAQGFRYLDAVNMFALLFAGLLLPIFARLIKSKETIKPILELGIKTLIPLSLIIAITAYFFQSDLISLRYTDNIHDASISFGFLILSFIPVSITYIFGTLLTANGSLKQLNYMAIGGLVLNVSLNLILIPKMKAEGAAIATLITQGVTALIQLVLVYYIFKLKINWKLTLQIVGLGISIILINFNIGYLFKSTISQIQLFVITLISSTILAFGIGVLPLKSLLPIFKDGK